MADAVEAFRQHVDQEPPDELGWTKRHGRVPSRSFDAVVLDFERDVVGIGRDQAGIRDSNAMGVARKIGEHEHPCWPPAGVWQTSAAGYVGRPTCQDPLLLLPC